MYEWLGIREVSLSRRMMVQYMIVMLQVGSLQVKDIQYVKSTLAVTIGCRGLVTLHWSRERVGLSRDDLCCMGGQSMSAARCLAIVSRGEVVGMSTGSKENDLLA